jgi:hypothetical protein
MKIEVLVEIPKHIAEILGDAEKLKRLEERVAVEFTKQQKAWLAREIKRWELWLVYGPNVDLPDALKENNYMKG